MRLAWTIAILTVLPLAAAAQDKDKPDIDPEVPQSLFGNHNNVKLDSFPTVYRDPEGHLQMIIHATVDGKPAIFCPLMNRDEKTRVLMKVDLALSGQVRPEWAKNSLTTPVVSPNGRKLICYSRIDGENVYQIWDRDPVSDDLSNQKKLGLTTMDMNRLGFDPKNFVDRGEYSTFSPDGNQLFTCVFKGNTKLGILEWQPLTGSLVALNLNAVTKSYGSPDLIIRAGDRIPGMPEERWGLRGDVSVSPKGDYYLVVNKIDKDLCILQVPRDPTTGKVAGNPQVLAKLTDAIARFGGRPWNLYHTPLLLPNEEQMIVPLGDKNNIEIVAVPMAALKLTRQRP